MKRQAGNSKLIRTTNLKLVTSLVKKEELISRADVAKILKLSAPSVSAIIEQLLMMGIVQEVGTRDLIGSGRPPMMLRFNPHYGYIIAIDLSGDKIRLAVGDLLGNIVAADHVQFSILQNITAADFTTVIQTINKLLHKLAIRNEQIKLVCVGTPGIIDSKTGFFHAAPRYKEWDKINVKQIISSEFDSDVLVLNDINLSIIGENRYGVAQGYANVLGLNIDIGIGAGLIIQGELYEGSRLAAGEVGYWIYDIPNIEEPGSFKNHYLDYTLSINALIQKVKLDMNAGIKSSIWKDCNHNIEAITFDIFCKAIREADEYAVRTLRQLIHALSIVISNISILLDLEMIVIGGDIIKLGDALLHPLSQLVNQMIPFSTNIVYSKLGERAGLYGGFAVSLDQVMDQLFED